jgi:predicted methyltransferase
MGYELQLKPFMPKKGWKYKTIRITDIALHTSHKQPTSIGKKLKQAFKSMKPGRIYGSISYAEPTTASPENKTALIDMMKKDPEFVKMVMEEEKNGYKVLLELPHQIPILAGKDTVEFLASVNGKRILRGLAKDNPES